MAAAETITSQIDPILAAVVGDRPELLAMSGGGPVRGTSRIMSDDPAIAGWHQGMTIRPGLSMFLNDVRHAHDHRYRVECGDDLKLHFRLSGESVIGMQSFESEVHGGALGYLTMPAFSEKFELIRSLSHERSITMVCSREFLAPMLTAECADMPRGIADFAGGYDPCFFYGAAPLPPHIRRLVEQLLDPADSGDLSGLRALAMESRGLELLHAALRHLTERRDARSGVSQRDQRRVDELRAILGQEGETAHSLAQLSRMLAWNETQMMESFRKVTGTTISSYRHRLRMDEALRKLRTTDASITSVAFDAGYNHSGNFATAFRRTFGFSPREARNGAH